MSQDTIEPQVKLKKNKHHGHPALGFILNTFMRLPMIVQIPGYLAMFLLYSPPAVMNLFACKRALTKGGRGYLRVISGPEYIFFYPLAAWGLVACALSHFQLVPDPILCWLYCGLFIFTAVTVGLDFASSGWFGLFVVVIATVFGLGWLAASYDVPFTGVFHEVTRLANMQQFPLYLVRVISIALLAVYFLVFIHMNLYDVLHVRGNYVEVSNFLATGDKNTRASYGIQPGTDDVNELFLGLCIPITLKAKTSRIKTHRFPNVPGGSIVEQVLTSLLNAQEVSNAEPFEDDGDDGEDDDS